MKLKIQVIIYCCFLCCTHIAYGQIYPGGNLVHNAGFELKESNADADIPDTWAQVDELLEWHDEKCLVTIEDDYGNDIEFYSHSPDWFKDSANHFVGEEDFATIPAHSGSGYIGMYPWELVQQELHANNPIIGGNTYTISMWVRTLNNDDDFSHHLNLTTNAKWYNANTSIVVRLGTGQLNYSAAAQLDGNRCSPTYFDHSWGGDQMIIMNHLVDLDTYPPGEWHKIAVNVYIPTSDFDWITIETRDPNYTCEEASYLLIDDVSLIRSCELGCYSTSGYPDPVFGSSNSNMASLSVSNLHNVSTAELEIYTALSQTLLWKKTVHGYNNGITNPIHWNGYSQIWDANGNVVAQQGPVANGSYMAKLKMWNDCGYFEETNNFVKVIDPDSAPPYFTYPNGPKIPLPCCEYDIHLGMETCGGYRLYHAGHDVTATGTQVTSSGIVELKAEHEIRLYPGFHAQPGSFFEAKIVDCANFRLMNPDPEAGVEENHNEEPSANEEKSLLEISGLIISPNPTNGSFTIQSKELIHSYRIYNSLGELVYDVYSSASYQRFDLSNQRKGVYIVRIKSIGGKEIIERVVLQ